MPLVEGCQTFVVHIIYENRHEPRIDSALCDGRPLPACWRRRTPDRVSDGGVVVKALLILWIKSLGVLIVAVLVLATTQHWDESVLCASAYCT